MSYISIFALAVALSMDAFAISVCKGLTSKETGPKTALACGVWFGTFQALMALIGYLAGDAFAAYIEAIDHWIAFVMLALIGANMIREAFKDDDRCEDFGVSPKSMFPLAIATSIDALAAGISLAMASTIEIWQSIATIGITTFAFSIVGAKFGSLFGKKLERNAQIAGGIILILIGIKILIEHLL